MARILLLLAALALVACDGTLEARSDSFGNDSGTALDAGVQDTTNADAASDDAPVCGDGRAERGETCDGNCPTSCDDGNPCTEDVLTGSPDTCDVECVSEPIEVCTDGDACCPAGCDSGNDGDCSATCGNDVVDAQETCDPADSCPTTCDDSNACTRDVMTGSAANCNVACSNPAITSCRDDDGCCPGTCDATLDNDCEPSCGNGVVEPGETCDGDCGTCNDGDSCTIDTSTGAADTCDLVCANTPITACIDDDGCCPSACTANNDTDCGAVCGNGVREAGEICDGDCPASCDDGMACTVDTRTGQSQSCNVMCENTAITACLDGDGCCAPGCNANNDDDCSPVCGNGIEEPGEECDGDCPASCDDGMACTADSSSGSAATCDLVCTNTAITACVDGDGCCAPGCDGTNDDDCAAMCGNGVQEPGETCDGDCPGTCDDGDVCTADSSSGSASACDLVCTNASITACTDGDGCCPAACDTTTDNDCTPDCRDPASWPTTWADFEAEVVRLSNIERAAGANCGSRGTFPPAGPVAMDVELQEAARCHSADMANNDFFSHTGSDGSSFSQRCNTAGYNGSPRGENIGAGYSSPSAVVTGWMNSDGHCANLMSGNIDEMGIGYYYKSGTQWRRYWTMVTGKE